MTDKKNDTHTPATDSASRSYSFLKDKEEDKHIEIDYDALTDLAQKDFSDPLEETHQDDVAFYCRTCKTITDVSRVASRSKKKQKVQFSCNLCKGGNVYYGTKRGIAKYFHLAPLKPTES